MCKVQCGSDMSLMNRLPRCYCKNQPPAELQNVTGIRPRGQAEAAWLRTTPTIAIAVVRNRLLSICPLLLVVDPGRPDGAVRC